jgi:hypothetical protein
MRNILLDIDGIHVIIVIACIELARIVRGDARGIGIFRQPTCGSALVACDAVLGRASPGGKRQTGGRGTAAAVRCCRTVAKTRDVFGCGFVGDMRRFAAIPVRRDWQTNIIFCRHTDSEHVSKNRKKSIVSAQSSVADPDPNPDLHVFGPPGSGSGSISQRYGSRSGSLYHHEKIVRKTSIPTTLLLFLTFYL